MGKQAVAQLYDGIPHSNKKEETPDVGNNMDESQMPYAK